MILLVRDLAGKLKKYIMILGIFALLLFVGCMSAGTSENSNNQNSGTEKDICQKIMELAPQYYKYEYVWGGDDFVRDGGVDCSGWIFSISKKIGKPVPRTTSKKYYLTTDSPDAHWQEANCTYLVWFTFSPDRPYGHVGIHLEPTENFTHSGSSTGPTEATIAPNNYWDERFEASKKFYK